MGISQFIFFPRFQIFFCLCFPILYAVKQKKGIFTVLRTIDHNNSNLLLLRRNDRSFNLQCINIIYQNTSFQLHSITTKKPISTISIIHHAQVRNLNIKVFIMQSHCTQDSCLIGMSIQCIYFSNKDIQTFIIWSSTENTLS